MAVYLISSKPIPLLFISVSRMLAAGRCAIAEAGKHLDKENVCFSGYHNDLCAAIEAMYDLAPWHLYHDLSALLAALAVAGQCNDTFAGTGIRNGGDALI